MTAETRSDDLLPAAVPARLGWVSAVLVAVVLIGMIVAAITGGINWLIGIGGAGTALGTLGLAYFTFAVAERTTELAGSSQRLEAAATQELSEGRAQAQAAMTAALEAQKSRIDALAPIIDFKVEFLEAHARPRGFASSGSPIILAPDEGQGGNLDHYSFDAGLALTFQNFGRTPGFVTMTHVGAAFGESAQVIRIDPTLGGAGAVSFVALFDYPGTIHDPLAPRDIRFEMEVRGAMIGDTLDRILWIGDLTLLERDTTGWHRRLNPLQLNRYRVSRSHGFDA